MRNRSATTRRIVRGLILAALVLSTFALHTTRAATEQDVFKSIQNSVGPQKEGDSTPAVLLAAGGAIVLIIFAVASRRQQKVDSPVALNHPGKLMKEIMRDVALKSSEVKQLKLLAQAVEDDAGETASPLALILCPSLMAKGLQGTKGKVDRKIVAQIVRKFRLNQPAKN
jgi:hypothetical protein